jgi:hypothetical protein
MFIGAVIFGVTAVVAQQMDDYHSETVRDHIIAGGTPLTGIATVIAYFIQRWRIIRRRQPR